MMVERVPSAVIGKPLNSLPKNLDTLEIEATGHDIFSDISDLSLTPPTCDDLAFEQSKSRLSRLLDEASFSAIHHHTALMPEILAQEPHHRTHRLPEGIGNRPPAPRGFLAELASDPETSSALLASTFLISTVAAVAGPGTYAIVLAGKKKRRARRGHRMKAGLSRRRITHPRRPAPPSTSTP